MYRTWNICMNVTGVIDPLQASMTSLLTSTNRKCWIRRRSPGVWLSDMPGWMLFSSRAPWGSRQTLINLSVRPSNKLAVVAQTSDRCVFGPSRCVRAFSDAQITKHVILNCKWSPSWVIICSRWRNFYSVICYETAMPGLITLIIKCFFSSSSYHYYVYTYKRTQRCVLQAGRTHPIIP